MADKWDQYAQQPGAQSGADKWDKYAQPAAGASTPPAEPSNLQKMWNVVKENLNPASMAEGLANISPPGMVYNGFKQMLHPDQPAPGPLGQMAQGSADMIKAIPQDLREGSYAHAIGHSLAAALPGVGPSAVRAGEEISHGAPAEGFTRAATTLAPFVGPPMIEGAGRALEGAARPMAKVALRLPGKAEAYGANPAKAALEETSGVRPLTVANSARDRISQLSQEQDAAANSSTVKGSLKPARDVVSGASTKAAGRNSAATPRELAPMDKFLNKPQPGFKGSTEYPPGANTPVNFKENPSPIIGAPPKVSTVAGPSPEPVVSEEQPASALLGMRRQFNQDFIRNWNPQANTKGALGTARQAYHALGDEVDKAIPGGAARDQRISSLIPVEQSARATDLSPTIGQRMLTRISRPTGALLPAFIGGSLGGPAGAMLGLGGAEAAASPVPLMVGARSLYGAGRALDNPVTPNLIRPAALPISKRKEPE